MSRNRRSLGLLKLGLIITSVVLFVATGALYVSQTHQLALLTATIRSSGWIAYQAQLEFVKAEAEFAKLSVVPTQEGLRSLVLRLEILRSRLPLLYDSDEGRVLGELIDTRRLTQPLEATLDHVMDQVDQLDAEDGDTAARLKSLEAELMPLGETLQHILLQSVAYNNEIFRRERALAETPAVVPLVLLFISGAGLAFLLFLQTRQDSIRLGEIIEAQNALAVMESNLRAVIQAVPACVVVVNPEDDRVTFFNPYAASLVGAEAGSPAWSRFVRSVREAASEPGNDCWGTISTAYVRGPSDIISLRGQICYVLWEGRLQHLIVVADTTRVRSAELQVMQAAKLATLGEMATAIAHELNQPLAVIKMAVANARRLLDAVPEGEPVLAKLERISAQVDRAKRITDQVRRYGRMPTEQLLPFSLRHAVELAVSFVAEQYRAANIRLIIEAGIPVELLVFGEQTMFEQVIVNLLINARDAFEAARSGTDSYEVTLTLRSQRERVLVVVQDNAGGVADDILPRLFEPFSTTKSTDKGTGLGLSLARSVIRDMNGSITVENAQGGARFVITLPRSRSAAEGQASERDAPDREASDPDAFWREVEAT